jgi:hypothetical protein
LPGSQDKAKYIACYRQAVTNEAAAATVINSPRAVEMSIFVVRAFVQLRELLTTNKELAKRLDELETRVTRKLATHDQAITEIIKTIRQLMTQPEVKKDQLALSSWRSASNVADRITLSPIFLSFIDLHTKS